jgi:hypothetical protein
MKKLYTGINIQYPISQLILSGEKRVETRTYSMPAKYIGEELLLIETPGKIGKFRSRIVAKIIFGASFQYKSSQEFYRDIANHQVEPSSPWAWKKEKPKWGWPILRVTQVKVGPPLRSSTGIVFRTNIEWNNDGDKTRNASQVRGSY